MPITPFGNAWEWRHSLWLVWLLFPFGFLVPISFIYISIRGRKLKWLITGVIYSLLYGLVIFTDVQFDSESPLQDVIAAVILLGWIVAWGLAFSARREYLQILAKRRLGTEGFNQFIEATREQILNSTITTPTRPMKRSENEKQKTEETDSLAPKIVQINKATKEELQALPGIDSLLATRIIETRDEVGAFRSYSNLVEQLKIQPHVLAKAQRYLTYTDSEYKRTLDRQAESNMQPSQDSTKSKNSGKRRRGRIVDY